MQGENDENIKKNRKRTNASETMLRSAPYVSDVLCY